MFEKLTAVRQNCLGHPVFMLAGVEWESRAWSVGDQAGQVYEIRATREDGAAIRLWERDDGQVLATIEARIDHGETADISQFHSSAEAAAAWALAYQPITREAAGAVWIQTHFRADYQKWVAAFGRHERGEISDHDDSGNWYVERYVGVGNRGFTLRLVGHNYSSDDGDGRIKSFEEAAQAAAGIFGMLADRLGEQYHQGFEDGQKALKAAIAGL